MRTPSIRGALGTFLLVTAALSLGAACGSSDSDPPGVTYKYPDVASLCDAGATAQCSASLVQHCATTADDCHAVRVQLCKAQTPSTLTYRPAQADACIDALRAAYADATLTADEQRVINAACSVVFEGTGTAGATCDADVDCHLSQSFVCVKKGSTGMCEVPKAVSAGDSCSAADAACTLGTHCNPTSLHCDKDGVLGDPCNATAPCDAATTCDAASTKCIARLADGTACHTDSECQGGICLVVGASQRCASAQNFSAGDPACDAFRPKATP